jgi:hypothetical protein
MSQMFESLSRASYNSKFKVYSYFASTFTSAQALPNACSVMHWINFSRYDTTPAKDWKDFQSCFSPVAPKG